MRNIFQTRSIKNKKWIYKQIGVFLGRLWAIFRTPMKLAASSEFHLCSWDIKQRKLRLSPFEQHGVPFPLVVAEGDILAVNVTVARLQLSDQHAFGYLPASQQTVLTDIVGERGKEQLSKPQHYPKNLSSG